MGVGALTEAIDALVGTDPAALGDPETIVELHRQLARLDAVVTAVTAAFDVSGAWAPDGARNAPAWLATRCRVPKAVARRRVRVGRRLHHLPECTRSWSEGEVTSDHVGAIAALAGRRTGDALERDEALIVGHARSLRFDQFRRALAYWESLAPTAPSRATRPSGPGVTSTWRPASRACGSGGSASTPSPGPSWPASSIAWSWAHARVRQCPLRFARKVQQDFRRAGRTR